MKLLIRFLFFIIGLFIMTFGVCMTIKVADIGVGAWDALNVALTERVGLSVGKWVMIDGAVLMIVVSLLLKRRPDVLSLLTIIVIGTLVDFWLNTIFDLFSVDLLFAKLAMLLIGILIIGFGASIYLQAKFPQSPIDSFMLAIKERFRVNLMVAKTIGEITALIPAFFLNGPISYGTIIITFAVGPAIQLFFPSFDKLMQKLQAKDLKFTKVNG
ncbi:membrane protein [Paenibacillus sp. BSR1-1]|uniref:YczE/YyaS/YitT family protein n=1 Tax=Paenibacillus sp. BSR1-1 TaxID=3020845 RepID=UPI0025B04B27|nr:membrane protein [Paenibacillus sp. BSR1-1]MDN3017637.1 membrane protein [Paenibacillus sp. BSR1-1]